MLPIIYRGHEEAGFFAHAIRHGEGDTLVETLPGNQRAVNSRYACLVPVLDFWRMSSDKTRTEGIWHYSQGIEPEILEDTRNGRAIIVFDLCNEGPTFSPKIFDELIGWISANALPRGRVIWMAQNRAIMDQAKIHFGELANTLSFEYYDFFIKMMSWIFSPQSHVQIYDKRPETAIERLFSADLKDRLLLCLNATPRHHRILAIAALMHFNLLNRSLVSFGGLNYVKTGANLNEVMAFVDSNESLSFLRGDIERVGTLPAISVDSFEEKGNALVSKIDPSPYERTFFSLITESDLSNGTICRVTEKTAKAFCMGHPSIVLGNPHSISLLTELGFEDWDGIIDRISEGVGDPAERFCSVFQEVLRQTQKIEIAPKEWIGRVREVGVWNIRHAFGGSFLSQYIARYDLPIVNRFCELVGL